MRMISAYSFYRRFSTGKRVVFVGNAPSLLGERLGSWIDGHDIVVRFNECPVVGFEDDIGSKTDIIVTNPYVKGRRSLPKDMSNVLVLVISPQTRRSEESEFIEWAGENDVFFTFTPDLIGCKVGQHRAGLTTGSYAISLLGRILEPAHVSISGFTMFLEDTSFHYFRNLMPRGLFAHDPSEESGIFIDICNNLRSNVEVTEEIAWVARKARVRLCKKIVIKQLLSAKWKK